MLTPANFAPQGHLRSPRSGRTIDKAGASAHRHPLPMIAVIFALPEESREFRCLLAASIFAERVNVSHCGVGPDAAARHIANVLAEKPAVVIATGFAGGLDPALVAGDIVVSTNHSDPALVARLGDVARGAFAHADLPIETIAAKATLARTTGAVAVDMESLPIATACARAGVPLLAVRALSDLASEPLPVPFGEWFDLADQRPRPVALVWYLVRHTSQIVPFVRFVRGLPSARRALAGFLIRWIEAEAKSSSVPGE